MRRYDSTPPPPRPCVASGSGEEGLGGEDSDSVGELETFVGESETGYVALQ